MREYPGAFVGGWDEGVKKPGDSSINQNCCPVPSK